MPTGYVTKNFVKLESAFEKGYATASLQGSSRSGKTYGIVQWIIHRCITVPFTSVSIVRKTTPSIKRSVYKDFIEIINMWGVNTGKLNKKELVYTFDNGSTVEFFSCENEQKLRGSKRQILCVNEANEISYLEWEQLQMRTTMFSIIDYNPSFSEEHWINQVNDEGKTAWWISTYKDNPFLEQRIIDEIESLQYKNPSLWRVYGLGLRAMVEGLVFPKFEIVNYMPTETMRHRYLGLDLGYSQDPTTIVEVRFYGDDMYINELCYRTHMLTNDIIRELKKYQSWSPEIISESADPRMIDEIYNAGLDIKPVRKYGGSIEAGIAKMQEFNIKITRQSTDVIKEFRNYTYRQDKEGKWLNQPIDSFNHACFTHETMVLTQRGQVHIDEVQQGDFALTSRGYRPICDMFIQGCREVWRVRLSFGKFAVEVEATPDHKFKTKEGWKQLKDLKETDVLYLSKFLMERNTSFIQGRSILETETRCCIGMCGSSIMAKFQKAMTCTMLTKIRTTMRFLILSFWKSMSTEKCTGVSMLRKTLLDFAKKWHTLLNSLKSGITRKKAESGIANMQDSKPSIDSIESISANAVEKNICQRIYRQSIPVSVPTTVSPSGAETTTLTTRQEFANGVGRSSELINTQKHNVVHEAVLESMDVLCVSKKPTYDICVANMHEFFANGVLVSNCDATRYVVLEKILGDNAPVVTSADILGLTD